MTRNTPIVILAGGMSRRMGEIDKAKALFKGERLVDRAISIASAQSDKVVLSARQDYGTGLPIITDLEKGPKGPAAGIYAAWEYFKENKNHIEGFVTLPVDGPNAPHDLIAKLAVNQDMQFAADPINQHYTFAYWPMETLSQVWPSFIENGKWSLFKLQQACGGQPVMWDKADLFFNVNEPEDLQ